MNRAVTIYPALDDENHGHHLPIDPAGNVEAIFRLRPPFYQKPEKGSESTRKPALYDIHLHGALLLRKAVFSPNLPEKLGMVATDALQKATLPPSGHGLGWISASGLEKKVRKAKTKSLFGELNVATTYCNLFSYIISIASVLEFPSSSWDTQFLELSISDSVHVSPNSDRGKRNNYAIADAILTINPGQYDLNMPSRSDILEDMEIMAKYFKRIVPFEFKSLSSGSYHVMLGILGHTLKDVFPWEGCDSDCAYEHGPKLGREPVTGDPLGFDAVISGADLIISTWDGKARDAYKAMSSRDLKKYKAHGRDMLQQIWAEMVKCDSTYAVLHAGKYELLFFRNRRNQTLHISDVIEPHNVGQETGSPGYYQIHIGLYISAVRDAINRARQLKDFGGDDEILPDTWTRPYDLGFGKYSTDPTPKLPFHDIVCKYMKLCLAPARNESRSLNYVRNRPYNRSTSPVDAEDKFFFLETRDHTSPNEFIGFLYVGEHTYRSWPVVIKVASGRNATKQLYKEYSNHVHLTAKRKRDVMIQKAYGLFTREEGKRTAYSILLLQYVGNPVPVEGLKYLTSRQQLAIQKTLWLLYKKGLVHGALSRRNIFMDNGPEAKKRHGRKAQLPWLTDLGHIRPEEADNEMRYERKKLRRWFKRDENDSRPPPPSHPIELGPINFKVENAKAAFGKLTSWMSQEPWLQTVDCSIKEDALSDGAWLVVKFFSSDAVAQFQEEWKYRPSYFLETRYENTSFNHESRESSQALSPSGLDSEESSQALSLPSGLDSEESSQASSAMVIG